MRQCLVAKRGSAASRPANSTKRQSDALTTGEGFFYAPDGQAFIGEPKILFIDIETTYEIIGAYGGIYEVNAVEMFKNTHIMSVAWRWGHEKTVHVRSWRHFKDYKKPKDIWDAFRTMNDRSLTEHIWGLVDEADIIVAHNGDAFDVPKILGRFLQHGLRPPRRFATIDTLKLFRKFGLDSNKQGYIARQFGTTQKAATHGNKTILGVILGIVSECLINEFYNKQDVVGLGDNFNLLERLGWMGWKPNRRKAITAKTYE